MSLFAPRDERRAAQNPDQVPSHRAVEHDGVLDLVVHEEGRDRSSNRPARWWSSPVTPTTNP